MTRSINHFHQKDKEKAKKKKTFYIDNSKKALKNLRPRT